MTDPVTDHLLRTLAAVPLPARVADLACADGARLGLIARLGFDVQAGAPTEPAAEAARAALADVLGEDEAARRVHHAPPDALPLKDGWADWAVLDTAEVSAWLDAALEARRVLTPGGWLFLAAPLGDGSPDLLTALAAGAGLALAEAPVAETIGDQPWVRGIYRRVDGADVER